MPSNKLNILPFMAEVLSPAFRDTLEMAAQVARFDSSVLISGDTGVGKEIIARYMHHLSARKNNSMLIINCGALPETLLESELFGHKTGSFTGAIQDRVGLFEQAARGTVFLDEIGEVSKAIQLKLLRVLQEREILRIGENIPRKVDIRIIAATNTDLDKAVDRNRFRKDLLYRLRVIEIKVPSLAQRPEDIRPLAEHFIAELSHRLKLPDLSLGQDCYEFFHTYQWPGNVRELHNAIERAAILCNGGVIEPKHLPPQVTSPMPMDDSTAASIPRTLAEVELEYIRQVLQFANGNRAHAAEILGIGISTLWRKLKQVSDSK